MKEGIGFKFVYEREPIKADELIDELEYDSNYAEKLIEELK